MAWKAGSGLSSTSGAALEAVREAQATLGGAPVTFGVVFASPQQDLAAAVSTAAAETGCGSIIGCTTAGELTERGLVHGGVATMLVSAPESVHAAGFTRRVKESDGAAARQLCSAFPETAARASAAGYPHSTTLLLIDGLAGTGERVLKQIMQGTRPFQQVVGGGAADAGAFRETLVAAPGSCGTNAAAVLHVFGGRRWGVGVDHGLRPQSPKMVVTRADGNVVLELDRQPAFEVYRAYAKGRGVTLTPENAGLFLINNELGVFLLDQLRCARAPLRVTPEGGLACASDIPQGSTVSILDGDVESMVAAAGRAAAEARENLGGADPAAVLLFDCIARHTIMGSSFHQEIEAVRKVFPGIPMAGFLTYGEIARYRGRLDGWHNTTAVVTAIPG